MNELPKCLTCSKQLSRPDAKYCAEHRPRTGKDNPKWAGGLVTVSCDNECGKTKQIKKSRLKSLKHHFCSRKCFGEWLSKNKEQIGFVAVKDVSYETRCKQSLAKGGTGVPYDESIYPDCVDCNVKLSRKDVDRCKSCWYQFMIGENHPNWKGGKSFEPYPLGWTKTFKEQIRYRDRYKCQNCGKPEIECKVSLHVHHIDYDKKNLEVNNLISLCPSCHTKSNFSRVYWQEFYQNKIKSMGYRNGRSDNNNQEATQGSI